MYLGTSPTRQLNAPTCYLCSCVSTEDASRPECPLQGALFQALCSPQTFFSDQGASSSEILPGPRVGFLSTDTLAHVVL